MPSASIVRLLCSLFLVLMPVADAMSVEQVSLQGIMGNMAVLNIDGKRRLVRAGEASPEGVRVLQVGKDTIELELAGERRELGLSNSISTRFQPPATRQAVLFKDGSGHFLTVGRINGVPVNMLVDTGASSVAMNSSEARRVGLDYLLYGDPIAVSTASGRTQGYRIKATRVAVAGIELYNVDVTVLEGGYPEITLLGMSFLGRLQMTQKADQLILQVRD